MALLDTDLSAARSWAESNLTSLEDPSKLSADPENGAMTGPVSIAVATAVRPPDTDKPDAKPASAEAPADQTAKPETRVAAVGDSDFAANAYVGTEGNRDLFMNTVNWLAQQENLIAIRPRDAADRRITLTANRAQVVRYLSIFIIPGAIFVAGVFVWWRRR